MPSKSGIYHGATLQMLLALASCTDFAGGKFLVVLKVIGTRHSLSISPAGSYFAAGLQGSIRGCGLYNSHQA
jgi:hypothetical protein